MATGHGEAPVISAGLKDWTADWTDSDGAARAISLGLIELEGFCKIILSGRPQTDSSQTDNSGSGPYSIDMRTPYTQYRYVIFMC